MALYMWGGKKAISSCAICVLPNGFRSILVLTQLFVLLHYLQLLCCLILVKLELPAVQKKE